MLIQVLKGLEAHHDIHRLVGDWNRRAASSDEVKVWSSIPTEPVLKDVRDDVDGHDARGHAGQQVGAVTFPTGDVEHPAVLDELSGEQIAVDMLEPDVARQFGHITLAGPFEPVVPVVCGRHHVFVARSAASQRRTAPKTDYRMECVSGLLEDEDQLQRIDG